MWLALVRDESISTPQRHRSIKVLELDKFLLLLLTFQTIGQNIIKTRPPALTIHYYTLILSILVSHQNEV